MTAKEKKIIQQKECDLANEVAEYRYWYAIMHIDKGVGYTKACEILSTVDYNNRITGEWIGVWNLMEQLGIEVDYDAHNDFSRKLWEYFNDKD